MFTQKSFRVCFIISLIIHSALFLKLPQINFFPARRILDRVELTYIKEKNSPSPLELYEKSFSEKKPLQNMPTVKNMTPPPPYIEKDQIFNKVKNIQIKKPELHRPEIIAVKKKITLPPLTDTKITSPVYLNYYQIIREKIKRAAYHNYTSSISGEVYLSFIILNDGTLKLVKRHDGKSSAHIYLKQIAERSIRDAAPFPSFPEELDYPELSFNVIISFEVE
jgi:outer membrane biosynthesis protein TonB